jgi:Cu+-exporting ATPase
VSIAIGTNTGTAEQLELEIEGMTCAGCAAKVEKALASLGGVEANVNAMTDRESVRFNPESIASQDLIKAVESVGYTAKVSGSHEHSVHEHAEHGMASGEGLGLRLALSAVLTIPTMVISMLPALQFNHWAWVAFALATPVALWGAWPFHRAALLALKHRVVGMDALVSLGVMAAWGWSVGALLFGGADAPGIGFDINSSVFGAAHVSGRLGPDRRLRGSAAHRPVPGSRHSRTWRLRTYGS